MKLFRSKPEREHRKREKRRETWHPLTERNYFLRLAEPRNHQDRIAILNQRIAEVENLYPMDKRLADVALETRSPEFAPEWPSRACLDSARDARISLVSAVCRKRSESVPPVKPLKPPSGNLLVYDPDETLSDGGSELVSDGYFDSTDEPGWNTWIDYYEDPEVGPRLLCYVPPPLIHFAQGGIDANPVACIYWIDCPELIPAS